MLKDDPENECKDDLKDEYKHLNDNMRHYSNMRFAQMTLFVAITAGLLSLSTRDPPLCLQQL